MGAGDSKLELRVKETGPARLPVHRLGHGIQSPVRCADDCFPAVYGFQGLINDSFQ